MGGGCQATGGTSGRAGEGFVHLASSSVARRYARALLSIGVEDGQYEPYAAQLSRVAQAFEASPELRDLWLNPSNDRERRMAAVEQLVGPLELSGIVANLLRLLVERERIGSLPDIVRAYQALVDEKVGRAQAIVTSATPLTPELSGSLAAALAQLTNKQIVLETRVDPKLIGGVVAQVGGTVLDGSLKTQLEQLRRTLHDTRV